MLEPYPLRDGKDTDPHALNAGTVDHTAGEPWNLGINQFDKRSPKAFAAGPRKATNHAPVSAPEHEVGQHLR